jgi:hypothetical protein
MSKNILEGAMKMSANSKARPTKRTRLRIGALSIALLLGFQSAHANAPVIDIAAIIEAIVSQFQALAEYSEEAQRWNQIKQQIQEAKITIGATSYGMNLPPGEELKVVDDDYLVSETCGSGAGGSFVSDLMQLGAGQSSYKAQQTQVCVNIRMMENRKYNDTVRFLSGTMKEVNAALQDNMTNRSGSNDSGNVQASDSDATRLANQLTALSQQWSVRIQSYDAYIATLKVKQNNLAKLALKGDPSKKLMGDAIQTAALKLALDLN